MISLTATELNRFMFCNGFKSLGTVEPFDQDDTSANEGNTAHWLAESVFQGGNLEELNGVKSPFGVFITNELINNCKDYIDFICYKGEVERPTSYKSENWEVRGRADHIVYNPETKTLTVSDLKYGWRIVEPENNWTLIWHAIGFLLMRNIPVEKVCFKIFQPRAFHPLGPIRTWEIAYDEFECLRASVLETLQQPQNILKCGEHCYKCKSLTQCPASQISAMNAIDIAETPFDSELSDEKLSWMLLNLKRAEELVKQSYKAYEDLALSRLKTGKNIKNFIIENSYGNKIWNDDINVEMIKTLYNVDITTSKLVTPAQAEKLGLNKATLALFTNRPNTGFKLVKVDEQKKLDKLFKQNKGK